MHTAPPSSAPWIRSDLVIDGNFAESDSVNGCYSITSSLGRDVAYCPIVIWNGINEDEAEALANASLIATAPYLLDLAKTMSGACAERLDALCSELSGEAEQDGDLLDQIAHWSALKHRCDIAVCQATAK